MPMKKVLFAVAATALIAGPARAQIPHITPFSFEARAGVALPTGDLNEDSDEGVNASPGLSLSGSVTYHAIPLIGIYAGGTYTRLGIEDSEVDLTDAGLDAGIRVGIPTPLIPIDPWIKGGVVVHQLKASGDGVDDSDWGTGFEVGGGLGFGFGPVSVTPGISYVHYNTNFDGEDGEVEVKASYVRADIGVRIRL
jgi:hypothetical protein